MNPELVTWLNERRQDTDLREWVADLLLRLCEVDTSLGRDLDRLRSGEQTCFGILTEAMESYLGADAEAVGLGVPASIADDPYYTSPYYAGDCSDDAEAVYRDRYNWLIDPAPEAGMKQDYWLLNAHVDTVPPHIPPTRVSEERIAGRGSADDKNGLVAMALVQRLLSEWRDATGESPEWPVRYLVSIDEEMGGNGTLGAVTHMDLARSHIVVAEPSSLLPFPANRGAVWFAASLRLKNDKHRDCLYGLYGIIAESLMEAGRALRAESEHPMFNASKDAQTCFGMLGPFGQHPSSACSEVSLEWPMSDDKADALEQHLKQAQAVVRQGMEAAVDAGQLVHDVRDPEVTLVQTGGEPSIAVRVYAKGGHMGSHERDSDALAKSAILIRAMEAAGFGCPRWPDDAQGFTLEGGQGFLPDRPLSDLQARMTEAFEVGVNRACEAYAIPPEELDCRITFDKLHNAAFCSANDAPGGQRLGEAIASLNGTGMPQLKGWKASCDARIFARQCPDVTTFGPGALEVAHSPDEVIDLQDILDMAAFFVHAVMQPAGGQ